MDILQAAIMRARRDTAVVRACKLPAPEMVTRETFIGPVLMPKPPDPPEPTVFEAQAAAYHAVTGPVSRIISTVAEFYGMSTGGMLSRRRYPGITTPRHIAMLLARELTRHSLPQIGKRFGGWDHTTVLSAVNRIKKLMLTDRELVDEIAELRRRLTDMTTAPLETKVNPDGPDVYRPRKSNDLEIIKLQLQQVEKKLDILIEGQREACRHDRKPEQAPA